MPQRPIQTRPPDLLEHDGVCGPQDVETLSGDVTDDPDGEPWAGEWLAPHDLLGQPKLLADGADFVLEQVSQRFDELEMHVVWETPDVVVALDLGGILGAGFDHIGVQRALYQVGGVVNVFRHLLEDTNEGFADDLPLALRVGDAGKGFEESVLRLDVHQVHVERASERLFHLRPFAFPE